MLVRSPYQILAVQPSASQEEIKKAFLKKARELHPDVNHSSNAGEQFKKVNEAYQLLSNTDARRAYDKGQKTSLTKEIIPYPDKSVPPQESDGTYNPQVQKTKASHKIDFDFPDLSFAIDSIGEGLIDEAKEMSDTVVDQLFDDLF